MIEIDKHIHILPCCSRVSEKGGLLTDFEYLSLSSYSEGKGIFVNFHTLQNTTRGTWFCYSLVLL